VTLHSVITNFETSLDDEAFVLYNEDCVYPVL